MKVLEASSINAIRYSCWFIIWSFYNSSYKLVRMNNLLTISASIIYYLCFNRAHASKQINEVHVAIIMTVWCTLENDLKEWRHSFYRSLCCLDLCFTFRYYTKHIINFHNIGVCNISWGEGGSRILPWLSILIQCRQEALSGGLSWLKLTDLRQLQPWSPRFRH